MAGTLVGHGGKRGVWGCEWCRLRLVLLSSARNLISVSMTGSLARHDGPAETSSRRSCRTRLCSCKCVASTRHRTVGKRKRERLAHGGRAHHGVTRHRASQDLRPPHLFFFFFNQNVVPTRSNECVTFV